MHSHLLDQEMVEARLNFAAGRIAVHLEHFVVVVDDAAGHIILCHQYLSILFFKTFQSNLASLPALIKFCAIVDYFKYL